MKLNFIFLLGCVLADSYVYRVNTEFYECDTCGWITTPSSLAGTLTFSITPVESKTTNTMEVDTTQLEDTTTTFSSDNKISFTSSSEKETEIRATSKFSSESASTSIRDVQTATSESTSAKASISAISTYQQITSTSSTERTNLLSKELSESFEYTASSTGLPINTYTTSSTSSVAGGTLIVTEIIETDYTTLPCVTYSYTSKGKIVTTSFFYDSYGSSHKPLMSSTPKFYGNLTFGKQTSHMPDDTFSSEITTSTHESLTKEFSTLLSIPSEPTTTSSLVAISNSNKIEGSGAQLKVSVGAIVLAWAFEMF